MGNAYYDSKIEIHPQSALMSPDKHAKKYESEKEDIKFEIRHEQSQSFHSIESEI